MTHFAGMGPEPRRKVDVAKYSPTEARRRISFELLVESPRSTPGSTFQYGNGSTIVGSMLEKLYGKPFETLLNQKIAAPLKLGDFGMGDPPDGQPIGHLIRDSGQETEEPKNSNHYMAVGPSGGIFCNKISDLAVLFSIWGGSLSRDATGNLLNDKTITEGVASPYGMGKTRAGFQSGKDGLALMHAGGTSRGDYTNAFVRPREDIVIASYFNLGRVSGRIDTDLDMAMLGTLSTRLVKNLPQNR